LGSGIAANGNRRGRRLAKLVVLTGVMLVTITGVAFAALKYRTSSTTLDTDSRESVKRDCPSGSKVTGGGISISSTSTTSEVASTRPVDGADANDKRDDAWKVTGNNGLGPDTNMSAYAICSTTLSLKRVSASRTVSSGEQKRKTVDCPSGTDLVGGGVHITGSYQSNRMETTIFASYPASDHGGWVGIANNPQNVDEDDETMTTYAICAESGTYAYVQDTGQVGGGAQDGVTVTCPAFTKVIGGGGKAGGSTPNNLYNSLNSSFPFDDDIDGDEDDGWAALMNNPAFASPVNITAYAVCKF
jgi:hypothetical protein